MIVILNTEKYVEKLQWKTLEGGGGGGEMQRQQWYGADYFCFVHELLV
jgi:hypothetical protein